jgi:hypothetical protein
VFAGGDRSFSELVRRYGGDLPAGAVRAELRRAGIVQEDEKGWLFPVKRWYAPVDVDPAFLDSMAFSLSNLADSISHNIELASRGILQGPSGRVERYVWTSEMSAADKAAFKALAESRAIALLEDLDEWIAERERSYEGNPNANVPSQDAGDGIVGLGVYYFERPPRDDH